MIGFRFINLLVPGDPDQFTVNGAHDIWTFSKEADFAARKAAIETEHKNAETYVGEHPVAGADGAAAVEGTVGELLPLCLGASYLTGRSVTVKRSIPPSDVALLQVGPRFPRERAIDAAEACVNNSAEFEQAMAAFLTAYPGAGAAEKVRLVVHHRLDALACWSLEDLYLSATTILQVVADTEESRALIAHHPSFFKYLTAAAGRFGIPGLNHDIVKMRNDLIHDGTVSGTHFSGKTEAECKAIAVQVLNWIDTYFHAALNLGPVHRVRFDAHSLDGLNSYSL